MGEYVVNPQNIKVLKNINMNATINIATSLELISTAYNKYCEQYGKDAAIRSEKTGFSWVALDQEIKKPNTYVAKNTQAPYLR